MLDLIMNKKIIFIILATAVFLVIGFFAFNSFIYNQKQANPIDTSNINSFEDCAKYFPVMESFPRQCNAGDKHFVEDITGQPADFTAHFEIYTNGLKRSFSSVMYQNLDPDVFISNEDPNMVNVKEHGITWKKFFRTLPFELTDECLTTGDGETYCTGAQGTLTFELNDTDTPDALELTIQPEDELIIRFK